MSNWLDAADADSLSSGECRTVEVGGRKLALARVGDRYFAVDNACPHRAGPLGAGAIEDSRIFCPLHGWAFDLASGKCMDRPAITVETFPIEIREGKVWVELSQGNGAKGD